MTYPSAACASRSAPTSIDEPDGIGYPTGVVEKIPAPGDRNVIASAGSGVVVLDAVVFVLGVAILGYLLFWWGRRIFSEK